MAGSAWAWPSACCSRAARPGMARDQPRAPGARTPVILDTDIGDDIDDTWALALLLRSPELDVKLVVGDYGKALYRARLIARFLTVAGRTDIPVGVGLNPIGPAAGTSRSGSRAMI